MKYNFNRRSVIAMAAVATAANAFPEICDHAFSADIAGEPRSAAALLDALEAKSLSAGVAPSTEEFDKSGGRPDSYETLLPRILDLLDRTTAAGADARSIADGAAELLSRIHRAERGGREAVVKAKAPSFDKLKAEYRKMFDSCVAKPAHVSSLAKQTSYMKKHRERYEAVSKSTSIPWHFIAIIHGLEASYNFNGHLHNGDVPLSKRTVHVPSGRPKNWNPPTDWESSAVDALEYEGFVGAKDWSLERTLYRWEAYNGFGNRAHGINTPYLWSYSTHYTKGKYIKDGVWDANAVSAQCGAAVLLKALVTSGDVILP